MHVISPNKRRSLVSVLAASAMATVLATGILADSSNTRYVDPNDPTAGITGDATLDWNSASELALLCSQNGTTVRMGLNVTPGSNAKVKAKIAFANPSVFWQEATGNTSAGWYKKNADGTTSKVKTGGADLTVTDVSPTVTGSASKKEQFTTGNPYVYYASSTSVAMKEAGHCNQGNGSATVQLKKWSTTLAAKGKGRVNRGACFTTNSSSNASIHQELSAGSLTQSDVSLVVYSNKQLTSNTDGSLTATSGSNSKTFTPTGTGSLDPFPGYHVWWGPVDVTVTFAPLDLQENYPKSAAQGIGGNPNVWLGLGPVSDNGNNYLALGRCKSL